MATSCNTEPRSGLASDVRPCTVGSCVACGTRADEALQSPPRSQRWGTLALSPVCGGPSGRGGGGGAVRLFSVRGVGRGMRQV